MDWVKLNGKGILRGTLSQSKDVVQLVWIKLLCLMNETKFRNGRFEYGPGNPFTMEFIAINCGVPLTIFEGCLCEYHEDINPDTNEPRIRVDDDGTLILVNWEKYQEKPEHLQAKDIAIEKGKETKRQKKTAMDRLIAAVNEVNRGLAKQRYEVTPDGKILDKATGEISDAETMQK